MTDEEWQREGTHTEHGRTRSSGGSRSTRHAHKHAEQIRVARAAARKRNRPHRTAEKHSKHEADRSTDYRRGSPVRFSTQELLAQLSSNRRTGFPRLRAISRAGIPRSICFAQLGRPGQDVDRQLLVLVLVGRLAPLEAVGSRGAKCADQRDAGLDRPERRAIDARESGSRRSSSSRACETSARRPPAGSGRRAARGRSSRRRTARRRPTARRPARTGASCRAPPRRSSLRTARSPDTRPRCRASGCSATAAPRAGRSRRSTCSRRQPSIVTTSRSAPMPKCSLNRRASSPIVMPWRIGIGYRPTNDSKPGDEHRPFDRDAADRIRPIADDHLDAVPARRAQAVRHRVDVGVDARADVLQIDDQHVEAAQHLRGRLARLAVERVDRHAPRLVAAVAGLDHVLLHVRAEPVLRAEQRGQLRPRCAPSADRRRGGTRRRSRPDCRRARRAGRRARGSRADVRSESNAHRAIIGASR